MRCFETALALEPRSASTLGALAFTHHLAGDLDRAIDTYHRALAARPDDTFCSEMTVENFSFAVSKTDAAHCTAVVAPHLSLTGSGIGRAGRSAHFTISAADACGHHRLQGGDEMQLRLKSPEGQRVASSTDVADLADGRYTASISLPADLAAGDYTVELVANGVAADVAVLLVSSGGL